MNKKIFLPAILLALTLTSCGNPVTSSSASSSSSSSVTSSTISSSTPSSSASSSSSNTASSSTPSSSSTSSSSSSSSSSYTPNTSGAYSEWPTADLAELGFTIPEYPADSYDFYDFTYEHMKRGEVRVLFPLVCRYKALS